MARRQRSGAAAPLSPYTRGVGVSECEDKKGPARWPIAVQHVERFFIGSRHVHLHARTQQRRLAKYAGRRSSGGRNRAPHFKNQHLYYTSADVFDDSHRSWHISDRPAGRGGIWE